MQSFWQDARPLARHPGGTLRRRRRLRRTALALAAILLGSFVLLALRGHEPAGADRAEPASPAERPVHPLWTQTLPDEPQAVATSAGRSVVVGTASVTAVGASGTRQWQLRVPSAQRWIAMDAATVLVGLPNGWEAIDATSGRPRWSVVTEEDAGPGALVPGDAPMAVVSTLQGGLVGIDARSGRTLWAERLDGAVRGTPSVDPANGAVVVVTEALRAQLRSLRALDGSQRWSRPIPPRSGSPVVRGGTVLVGAGDGRYHSEVDAVSALDGRLRWRSPMPASFQPDLAPAVHRGIVYAVDQLGHLAAFDLDTGHRRWVADLNDAVLLGAPVPVGDALVVADSGRELVTVDAASGGIRMRRRATGVPVGVLAVPGAVLVAQRLVTSAQLGAFPAMRLANGR
jgi:outer membrane protein assembly factor BamB